MSCGGCPGKGAAARTKTLKKLGAAAAALSSCITPGTPIGFPCPSRGLMLGAIQAAPGDDFPVLDHTHAAPAKKRFPAPASGGRTPSRMPRDGPKRPPAGAKTKQALCIPPHGGGRRKGAPRKGRPQKTVRPEFRPSGG